MSIAIKSTLNPLADSFIPSSCLKMVNKDEGIISPWVFNEKISKHEPQDLTADFNSMHIDIKDEYNIEYEDHDLKLELSLMKSKLSSYSGRNSLLSDVVKSFVTPESTLCRPKSELLEFQEHLKNYINVEKAADFIDSSQIEDVKQDQCRCPPMFGWVVPPEFFGNPFNLKYDCSKRHAHISDQESSKSEDRLSKRHAHISDQESSKSEDRLSKRHTRISDQESSESEDGSLNLKYDCSKRHAHISDQKSSESEDSLSNWTLDKCYLEFEAILKDIHDCFSEYTDLPEKWEKSDNLEVTDYEIDSGYSSKRSSLDSDCQENLELVDDGCHPLLESLKLTAIEYEDEDKEPVERVQEILQDALAPAEERSSKSLTSHQKVCNPPCSVWCDSVPTAAVSTYRKFIREFDAKKNRNEPKYLGRPIYKRSFSENDSLKYGYFDTNLSRLTSATKSKDRLAILQKSRHDILNGLKGSNKCASNPVLSDFFLKSSSKSEDDSNMWGPFDGADSLWQPLPDCVPSNEHNLKPNYCRRARDMRRQKSVN